MKLSEIGEFGLIRLLTREFGIEYPPHAGTPPAEGLLVGLGDDAVVTARRDGAMVWTTDTMVAGEHFLPELRAWRDAGWKALASNVSDIAAMGATPHLALVTLTLPPDSCVDDILELYRGLHEAATKYGVTLGGGDIVRSPVFAVTVALGGWAFLPHLGEPRVLRRDAARPGDLVAVSGAIGDSAGGLRLLLAGGVFETEAAQRLLQAHLRPQPRVELGQAAVREGVRCAIDVSDGLVQDLGHIAEASGAGIVIEASRVPQSEALRRLLPSDALTLALTGGEDYELVLVAPEAVLRRVMAQQPDLTLIGEVIAADGPFVRVIDERGADLDIEHGGWDHFTT